MPLSVLKHFDLLVEQGLKIIPLRENTKSPICKGWPNWDYSTNRSILQRFPNSNIGILLGDIIDVEGDSEEANKRINDLIGDYSHPSYTSFKSTHHLFKNPDPKLTIFKFEEIEFRGHRHQSVLPPSSLPNGVVYKWLRGSKFPIPEMPPKLLNFYRNLRRSKYSKLKPNHLRVRCANCNKFSFIHQKRFDLELQALKTIGLRWKCQECREFDLRPMCRKIRKQLLHN